MLKKQDVREGSGFIVAHATISNFDTLWMNHSCPDFVNTLSPRFQINKLHKLALTVLFLPATSNF
jgi:hypothetical protein